MSINLLMSDTCFRWVSEHFVKAWCERNFSLLPPELHRACLTAVTETMVSLSLIIHRYHEAAHQCFPQEGNLSMISLKMTFIKFSVINGRVMEKYDVDRWEASSSLLTAES